MDSTPPHRSPPGRRPERARLVQPESKQFFDSGAQGLARRSGDLLVPAAWARRHLIEDRSETALAKRLERNKAEHLTMQLEASLGRSSTWDRTVKADLWEYGVRVLPAKIVSGEIFRMMREVNGPSALDLALPDRGPAMTSEEAHDLASDVVVWALRSFKDVLLDADNGWRADGGASFRTFFIGKCCHGFAGIYRRWLRARAKRLGLDELDQLSGDELPVAQDRPEQAAIIRVQIDHYIDGCTGDLEVQIACLNALEFSNRDIAELLGVTEKVVEYRLSKNARGAQDRWARGTGEMFRGRTGEVA